MRFIKWVLLAALSSGIVPAQDRRLAPIHPHKQIALVIGNSAYRNRPLVNPANDAHDVGARLAEIGFDTQTVLDADRKQMAAAIDRFVGKISTGDVALFYYSGHGTEIDGENYLIPVDFEGHDETDLRYDTQAAGKIQERMERSGAQLNIIVLDACRDNPFHSSSRSTGGGLAAMNAGRGTFVAFATSPGRTASDNSTGRNGLFTQYFLQALRQPGLGLDDVFNIVRERVDQASGGKQLPWSQTGVVGRYTFVAGAAPPVETSSSPAALVARAELLYKAEDYQNAAPLFLEAAEAGNVAAEAWMGKLYSSPRGVKYDAAEAFRWYKKAADAGDPAGMAGVGRLYAVGFLLNGVSTQDFAQAAVWSRKAADQGQASAMELLGELYEGWYPPVPKDLAQSVAWYRKAVAAGDDTARINLRNVDGTHAIEVGEEKYKAKDFEAALFAFKQGAEEGNPAAMGRLGDMLRDAEGAARDTQAAFEWFKKAADKGDGRAMYSIGQMYGLGLGLLKDQALSVEWYKKAAAVGYANAFDVLGLAYSVGQGVPKDRDQAIFWYRKSLAAGNETARIYLKQLGAEP